MAQQKKQVTYIGNGSGNPILARENAGMAGELKPSQSDTGKGQNGTKPLSVTEALSLWQTACFDLQSFGFQTAILAENNAVFLLLVPPASIGKLTFEGKKLRLDGLPVSDL